MLLGACLELLHVDFTAAIHVRLLEPLPADSRLSNMSSTRLNNMPGNMSSVTASPSDVAAYANRYDHRKQNRCDDGNYHRRVRRRLSPRFCAVSWVDPRPALRLHHGREARERRPLQQRAIAHDLYLYTPGWD